MFSGNAHLEGGASPALDLHGGESVALNATDPDNYNLAESIEPDSWDAWNSDRDQELTTASADRTAATNNQPDSNNPAWSDLDANGNWYNVPDQGYVWSPNEAASTPGWDPYGNGYWMNSPSYGYMWISGYPWGYLPYQCGAWNYYNSFGWGWAPAACASPGGAAWGGWGVNIGYAPPRYRYPDSAASVRNPRPMVAHGDIRGRWLQSIAAPPRETSHAGAPGSHGYGDDCRERRSPAEPPAQPESHGPTNRSVPGMHHADRVRARLPGQCRQAAS